MKIVVLALLLALPLSGCELLESNEPGPNDMGGTNTVVFTEVGNNFSIFATLDGKSTGAKVDTCYIKKNDNGIITIHVKLDLTNVDTNLKKFIPKEYVDPVTGNVDQEFKLKVTSEGIQDYYYSKGDESKPFTIVKHEWGVGQKWSYTTDDGKTITREVTEKTGKDDFPMGFFMVKTTKIEESNPGVEGITHVTFRTNHRFGLIFVEYTLVTGQTLTVDMIPDKA